MWPLVTDFDELGWDSMAGELVSPLSSYCADQTQLSEALYFIMYSWPTACVIELDFHFFFIFMFVPCISDMKTLYYPADAQIYNL